MTDTQLVMLEKRAGTITGLMSLRARPSGMTGEWMVPQSVTVESLGEGAFDGLALGERMVVLRYSEAMALLNNGEVR